MAELFDCTLSVPITRFLQCELGSEATRVVSKALDGTTYIQVIGDPAQTIKAVCYVDRTGKAAVETASANDDLLRVSCKHGVYYGRIIEVKYGERQAGDTFKVTMTLSLEETE